MFLSVFRLDGTPVSAITSNFYQQHSPADYRFKEWLAATSSQLAQSQRRCVVPTSPYLLFSSVSTLPTRLVSTFVGWICVSASVVLSFDCYPIVRYFRYCVCYRLVNQSSPLMFILSYSLTIDHSHRRNDFILPHPRDPHPNRFRNPHRPLRSATCPHRQQKPACVSCCYHWQYHFPFASCYRHCLLRQRFLSPM